MNHAFRRNAPASVLWLHLYRMQIIFEVAAFSTKRRIPDGMQGNHHAKSLLGQNLIDIIFPW
jgi:hypothetical protein